jgi:hypothetical protein
MAVFRKFDGSVDFDIVSKSRYLEWVTASHKSLTNRRGQDRTRHIHEEHRGEFQNVRKECQKHIPEISGWIGNYKTVYIATRKPQNTKLMKKQ